MGEIFDMHDFVAAGQGDVEHMLGKFLYFSLANLLVEKEELSKLCEDLGIPYSGGTRLSVSDAFRSATGDIRERVPVTAMGGDEHLPGLLPGQQAHLGHSFPGTGEGNAEPKDQQLRKAG